MMFITALLTATATYTQQTLLNGASRNNQATSGVACRRSGQDGTVSRGSLVNGSQTTQQVRSSFMREALEDEDAFRSFQAPVTNGCNKKTLGSEEPTCRKSFMA
jgi:hypothetical protein